MILQHAEESNSLVFIPFHGVSIDGYRAEQSDPPRMRMLAQRGMVRFACCTQGSKAGSLESKVEVLAALLPRRIAKRVIVTLLLILSLPIRFVRVRVRVRFAFAV